MLVRIGDSVTVGPFYARLTDGTIINLIGASIEASVATARGAAPLVTKQNTTAGGSDLEILVTDTVTGEFYVYLGTGDTLQMTPNTTYFLDARVKTVSGAVSTVGESRWKAITAYTPVPTP